MSEPSLQPPIIVGLNAVIVAVTEEVPRVLTVPAAAAGESGAAPASSFALPFGPLDPQADATLELGLRRWVREQTGLELGYVEQLYTFGDRDRAPAARAVGKRAVSVAYLGLMTEEAPAVASGASWLDAYRFLPWEDWREGRPTVIEGVISPVLATWVEEAANPQEGRQRRERADIAFGLGGAPWVGERVLERYELLYQVGLALEASRDRGNAAPEAERAAAVARCGEAMVLDHRRILATALGRLRGKLRYRPVIFELLPPQFTLFQLQRVVEALAGVRLHKGNFRRLLEGGGLVEGTNKLEARTGGRPAELFRFRRDVLRERPAPGVGIPGLRG